MLSIVKNLSKISLENKALLWYDYSVILWHFMPIKQQEDFVMKQLCKRSLALLLTLVILVGLLPAITLQTSAASYIYNWGTRGELATELSATAEAWYRTEGTS